MSTGSWEAASVGSGEAGFAFDEVIEPVLS